MQRGPRPWARGHPALATGCVSEEAFESTLVLVAAGL